MILQIRLILAGLLVFALCFLTWFIPRHYREEGRQEVIHKYEEASRIALQERKAEIERLKLEQENTNKLVVADYENKLSLLNERYLAAKRDGLRLPRVACERPATVTEAKSTSGSDEGESIRLPATIEDGLFDLARQADEVNAQLSACQAWIKKNGFY